MKILVIEDDEIQHELVGAIFKQIGTEGFFCVTGEDGLEKLKNHFFDAVLLDIGLPGKSGVQVLKAIRENVMTKDIPVIVLTASKTRETLMQCMKHGISDYIGKPFQLQQFAQKFATLRRLISFKNDSAGKTDAAKVLMERVPGIAKFTFGGKFVEESLQNFMGYYTPAFRGLTKSEALIFNFAALPGFGAEEIRVFRALLQAVAPKMPLIVAGRSYGPLIPHLPDYESQLFLIEEDALEFLKKKR